MKKAWKDFTSIRNGLLSLERTEENRNCTELEGGSCGTIRLVKW